MFTTDTTDKPPVDHWKFPVYVNRCVDWKIQYSLAPYYLHSINVSAH